MIIKLVGFLFVLPSSELEDVREHDRRVTEEAETAQRDVRSSSCSFVSFIHPCTSSHLISFFPPSLSITVSIATAIASP